MNSIDRYRPGDEDDLAEVCVRTADAGADATGMLPDDRLWAEIFVLPYVARHPECAFVVRSETGRVTGYIVGAPDTASFETWFRDAWWPARAGRWQTGSPRQDGLLRYAAGRGGADVPYAAEHPAHLHIDLLPELQGQGWGRRLIDTLVDALRADGVRGVHLVAGADNAGAAAFYPRVGFTPLASGPDERAFGRAL